MAMPQSVQQKYKAQHPQKEGACTLSLPLFHAPLNDFRANASVKGHLPEAHDTRCQPDIAWAK
jgi:hypothetical protein